MYRKGKTIGIDQN